MAALAMPLGMQQDGTRVSIAHDTSDSNTTFSPSVNAAVYRIAKLQRGMEVSKAFKMQEYHKSP